MHFENISVPKDFDLVPEIRHFVYEIHFHFPHIKLPILHNFLPNFLIGPTFPPLPLPLSNKQGPILLIDFQEILKIQLFQRFLQSGIMADESPKYFVPIVSALLILGAWGCRHFLLPLGSLGYLLVER